MKNYYPVLFAFLSLFSFGCSSYYTSKQFSSREEFYNSFNDFAKGKNLKVALTNDSVFTVMNSVRVIDDTLCHIDSIREVNTYNRFYLSDIKNINYTSNDYKSAEILLKDNEAFQAQDIKIDSGMIYFHGISDIYLKTKIIAIAEVKEIDYKNRWIGLVPGLLGGFVCGALVGIPINFVDWVQHLHKGESATIWALGIGVAAGTTLGIITGWFIGNNYIYQFNP